MQELDKYSILLEFEVTIAINLTCSIYEPTYFNYVHTLNEKGVNQYEKKA
ncbi:Uncharacterised protein [Carnobacterium divergens]|nr:Uncharacterised protein [Carnobacterium divergens]